MQMYFDPPERRPLRLMSRIPDALRRGQKSDWARTRLLDARLDVFLEGPCMADDGDLLVVDIPFGRILRLSGAAEWSVAHTYDGWPNGMRKQAGGRLLIADHKRGLLRLDLVTGAIETLLDSFEGAPLHGLNDLVVARNGDIYVTDQGASGLNAPYGRLLRLSAAGEVSCLLDSIQSPNGLVLSPDERTIFLAVTRANAIWRVPLDEEGKAQKVGLFIQLSGGVGPDGMAYCSRTGSLLIVHPGLGVWSFDDQGRPKTFYSNPDAHFCTNLVERIPGSGQFLVTESKRGEIYAFETALPEGGSS